MNNMEIEVLKFGGSCFPNEEGFKRVVEIIIRKVDSGFHPVIVVSAPKDMTDLLIKGAKSALEEENFCPEKFVEGLRNYQGIISSKQGVKTSQVVRGLENEFFCKMTHALQAIKSRKERGLLPYIESRGETYTSIVLCDYLLRKGMRPHCFSGEDLIITDENKRDAMVYLEETEKRVKKLIKPSLEAGKIPIITGFAGRSKSGSITTLGRGGSDYTAAVLGFSLHPLGCGKVVKYSNVDGILSYDPNIVSMMKMDLEIEEKISELPKPRIVEKLSYLMAQELEEKVLQPKALVPLERKGIPLFIKNIYNPRPEGTEVSSEVENEGVKIIRVEPGLNAVRIGFRSDISRVEQEGEILLALKNIKVPYHSSSRAEMSLLVYPLDLIRVRKILMGLDFPVEIAEGKKAILSVIGFMRKKVGTFNRATKALANYGVNIEQSRQTVSEYTIDFGIDERECPRGTTALIEEFLSR